METLYKDKMKRPRKRKSHAFDEPVDNDNVLINKIKKKNMEPFKVRTEESQTVHFKQTTAAKKVHLRESNEMSKNLKVPFVKLLKRPELDILALTTCRQIPNISNRECIGLKQSKIKFSENATEGLAKNETNNNLSKVPFVKLLRRPELDKLARTICQNENIMKFYHCIEFILENVDQKEPNAILTNPVFDDLCKITSKLKLHGVTNKISTDQVIRLFTVFNKIIKESQQLTLITEILKAADACLVCLHVMTSPNMSLNIFLGELIDNIIIYVRCHLQNKIYPAFDNPKTETRKKVLSIKNTNPTQKFYCKILDVTNLLSELLNKQTASDSTIIFALSTGLSTFNIENINSLQLACIRLLTILFKKYSKFQKSIIHDILNVMQLCQQKKKNTKNYRISEKKDIHMVSALLLNLIQSVTYIENKYIQNLNGIAKMFDSATELINTCINTLVKKSKSNRSEVGLKHLIEDLLTTVYKPEWPAAELFLLTLGRLLCQNIYDRNNTTLFRINCLEELRTIATHIRQMNITCDNKSVEQLVRKYLNRKAEKTNAIRQLLIDYLSANSENEIFKYAKFFHISHWFKHKDREIKNDTFLKLINCDKKNSDIDENQAKFLSQNVSLKDTLADDFDYYCKIIFWSLREPVIGLRIKSMKCIKSIVQIDTSTLAAEDVRRTINHSLHDVSIAVREAAVDLIGKCAVMKPELFHYYYEQFSERILDKGVSVRKRVIKILKQICLKYPNFHKVPEICVKLINRVNDEESIQKLVVDVFQNMWFLPVGDKIALNEKVLAIISVVEKCTGLQNFEQLLTALLKPKEDKNDSSIKLLIKAMEQIVDHLIEYTIRQPEITACFATLNLFAKIRPELYIKHIYTIQQYLSVKSHTEILRHVTEILENVIPVMKHPAKIFLADIEEISVKIITQFGQDVLLKSTSLLRLVIYITRNYKLISDLFLRFYNCLLKCEQLFKQKRLLKEHKRKFRRSIYTIGLIIQHFDLTDETIRADLDHDITVQVFNKLINLAISEDEDIVLITLYSIGLICVRHEEFMFNEQLKKLYNKILMDNNVSIKLKQTVLINIHLFLTEDEKRMIKLDKNIMKRKENLRDLDELSSGRASIVIQIYLEKILKSYVHPNVIIRCASSKVAFLILNQGLVHPCSLIPYLMAMSSDVSEHIINPAEKYLTEIARRWPEFLTPKMLHGLSTSYEIQKYINTIPVRGFKLNKQNQPEAVHKYIYLNVQNKKQQRALLISIINCYKNKTLDEKLYLADNLAYLPYLSLEEPLFIINKIDIEISLQATDILRSFYENLNNEDSDENKMAFLDEENENVEELLVKLPKNINIFRSLMDIAQGYILLLLLKKYLQDIYGILDISVMKYSQNIYTKNSVQIAKLYNKSVIKKNKLQFDPKSIVARLTKEKDNQELPNEERKTLIIEYLEFKKLVMNCVTDTTD